MWYARFMSIRVPRRLSTDVILSRGPIALERHRVAAPGGPEHDAFTLRFSDWVSIAAVTTSGLFILVRQHRHGIDDVTIEPAGGIVDAGEDPAHTAIRELIEETGYTAEAPESLGWVYPNPALQTNRSHLFLARGAVPAPPELSHHQNDEHESTEAVVMTRDEVVAALRDHQITHALGVLTLERALARLA